MPATTEMAVPDRGTPDRGTGANGPLRRLGWFVLLWAGGVLAVGTVAYLIRWALFH